MSGFAKSPWDTIKGLTRDEGEVERVDLATPRQILEDNGVDTSSVPFDPDFLDRSPGYIEPPVYRECVDLEFSRSMERHADAVRQSLSSQRPSVLNRAGRRKQAAMARRARHDDDQTFRNLRKTEST